MFWVGEFGKILQGRSDYTKQMYFFFGLRGGSILSPDTRLECFLRGAKFLAKNLRGSKF